MMVLERNGDDSLKNDPNLIHAAPRRTLYKEYSQEQACNNEEEQRVVHQVKISPAEPGHTGV